MKKCKLFLTLGLFLALLNIAGCNMGNNMEDDKNIIKDEYVKAYKITYSDFVTVPETLEKTSVFKGSAKSMPLWFLVVLLNGSDLNP